jgi:hypothetical protein
MGESTEGAAPSPAEDSETAVLSVGYRRFLELGWTTCPCLSDCVHTIR